MSHFCNWLFEANSLFKVNSFLFSINLCIPSWHSHDLKLYIYAVYWRRIQNSINQLNGTRSCNSKWGGTFQANYDFRYDFFFLWGERGDDCPHVYILMYCTIVYCVLFYLFVFYHLYFDFLATGGKTKVCLIKH